MTAADLYDERTDTFREVNVEIAKIEKITLTGKKGRKDGRPGVWFKGQKSNKPLGLNATNCGAIENVTGTSDMKRWIGAVVTLRVEIVEIRGEGRRPAIRISPFAPGQQRAARGDNHAWKFTPEEVAAARESIASDTAGIVGAEEIGLATNPHDKAKIDADEARQIADRERKEQR